jgi:hypothetical protein
VTLLVCFCLPAFSFLFRQLLPQLGNKCYLRGHTLPYQGARAGNAPKSATERRGKSSLSPHKCYWNDQTLSNYLQCVYTPQSCSDAPLILSSVFSHSLVKVIRICISHVTLALSKVKNLLYENCFMFC